MLRAIGWLLLFSAASALSAAEKRPNIVFCFADDWGRYASAYAQTEQRPSPNQVIKTPHIDSVAARGVMFTRAFVNAPSCTPCRSALLSGRYFFNAGRGAILNGAVWDEAIPAFPLLLRDAGYAIGKTGKVWSPGTPADAPFGGQKYSFQKSGMRFNGYSEVVTAAVEGGARIPDIQKELLNEVRGNFGDFLAKRPADQPFLYWFGPTNVHRSWVRGSGKRLWGIEPDSLKGKLPGFLPDVPEVREDFADYLGEIQAWDAYIGVLLDELRRSGELDKTIIVISGDHGAPGFPYGKCNLYDFGVNVALLVAGPGVVGGRTVDDFVNLMDLAPTFCELSAVPIPAGMNGRSFVPLLRSRQSGRIDPARDYVITGRERHVANAREGNKPYPQRAFRTDRYLYIRNFAPDRDPLGGPGKVGENVDFGANTLLGFSDMDAGPTKSWLIAHRNDPQYKPYYDRAFGKRPGEELYDLSRDPDQLNNVAADPAYAAALREQGERLMSELRKVGDPRVVEEDCRFEREPFTGPREAPGKAGAKSKAAK